MPGWSTRVRKRLRDAAPARARRAGRAGAPAGSEGGAEGPRVGAPEGAIAGFSRAAGLASISEASIQKDPKKGEFYVAMIEKPGRPAIDVIGELLPDRAARLSRGRNRCAGARVGQAHEPRMGTPATHDRCDLRPRNRGAGDRAGGDRRYCVRRRHLWPSLPGARRDHGAPPRGLLGQARKGQGRARPGAAAARSS